MVEEVGEGRWGRWVRFLDEWGKGLWGRWVTCDGGR